MIFHVTARGNDGQKIFHDSDDLSFFCGRLRELSLEMGFRVHAYCLMTNHVHLLLEAAAHPLGLVMHRLLTVHSHRFNLRRGRTGHLFQERFAASHCKDQAHFVAAARYIHRNPVAAGLVVRPEDWKFSGHRELLGAAGQSVIARERTLDRLFPDSPSVQSYLGLFRPGTPNPLAALAERVGARLGCLPDELRWGRSGFAARGRRELAAQAVAAGFRGSEVARFLGVSGGAVTQMLARSTEGAQARAVAAQSA